jgi:hypothetical protein
MKRKPTILEQLRWACIRYGLEPEVIGPANAETFTDEVDEWLSPANA